MSLLLQRSSYSTPFVPLCSVSEEKGDCDDNAAASVSHQIWCAWRKEMAQEKELQLAKEKAKEKESGQYSLAIAMAITITVVVVVALLLLLCCCCRSLLLARLSQIVCYVFILMSSHLDLL